MTANEARDKSIEFYRKSIYQNISIAAAQCYFSCTTPINLPLEIKQELIEDGYRVEEYYAGYMIIWDDRVKIPTKSENKWYQFWK